MFRLSYYDAVNDVLLGIIKEYNEEIVQPILSEYPEIQIYLFGSCARGEAICHSNIDVAYVIPNDMKPYHIETARDFSERTIPVNVSFITFEDYDNCTSRLIEFIRLEGIPWKNVITSI